MDNNIQFCTECGFKMDKDYGFCPKCGAKIHRENQEPGINTPPFQQVNQNYETYHSNYTNMHIRPDNIPPSPPDYSQYGPPQYVPLRKNSNPLTIVLIIIGVLILAAGGYFGLKLLQGKTADTLNVPSQKSNIVDQDISGTWEGTVVLNDTKNLKRSSDTEQIFNMLNKPLKTKMEIAPESQSQGEISIYMAENVGEEPRSEGLPLSYEFNGGNLKAEAQEYESAVALELGLESKNGTTVLKGTMSVSAEQSDGSIGTIKGTVEINRTSKEITSADSSKDKLTGPDTGNKSGENVKVPDNSNNVPNTGKAAKVPEYIEDPALYLPKPPARHTYESNYVDGSTSKYDVVMGLIPNFSLVTSVELIEQSEPFTQHFVDGADGVYVMSDQEFNTNSYLWLPFNARAGQTWDDGGVSHKIIELGATCSIGSKRYENCIVAESHYLEEGSVFIYYIAPNIGTVLVKDKVTGQEMLRLLSITPLKEKEANDIVQQYSPNVVSALGN